LYSSKVGVQYPSSISERYHVAVNTRKGMDG